MKGKGIEIGRNRGYFNLVPRDDGSEAPSQQAFSDAPDAVTKFNMAPDKEWNFM